MDLLILCSNVITKTEAKRDASHLFYALIALLACYGGLDTLLQDEQEREYLLARCQSVSYIHAWLDWGILSEDDLATSLQESLIVVNRMLVQSVAEQSAALHAHQKLAVLPSAVRVRSALYCLECRSASQGRLLTREEVEGERRCYRMSHRYGFPACAGCRRLFNLA